MTEHPMETTLRTALWRQFGAAIDMLENALVACPASLWRERLWSVHRHRSSRRSSRSSGMSPFMRWSGSTCISQASRRRNLLPLLPLPKECSILQGRCPNGLIPRMSYASISCLCARSVTPSFSN